LLCFQVVKAWLVDLCVCVDAKAFAPGQQCNCCFGLVSSTITHFFALFNKLSYCFGFVCCMSVLKSYFTFKQQATYLHAYALLLLSSFSLAINKNARWHLIKPCTIFSFLDN